MKVRQAVIDWCFVFLWCRGGVSLQRHRVPGGETTFQAQTG